MTIEELLRDEVRRAVLQAATDLADAQQSIMVTLEEAARLYSCSTRQIQCLVAQGVLKPTRWPGDDRKRPRPYFLRSELIEAARRHQKT